MILRTLAACLALILMTPLTSLCAQDKVTESDGAEASAEAKTVKKASADKKKEPKKEKKEKKETKKETKKDKADEASGDTEEELSKEEIEQLRALGYME